jgi:hypothetical protein
VKSPASLVLAGLGAFESGELETTPVQLQSFELKKGDAAPGRSGPRRPGEAAAMRRGCHPVLRLCPIA